MSKEIAEAIWKLAEEKSAIALDRDLEYLSLLCAKGGLSPNFFTDIFAKGPVLDAGCGQAKLVAELLTQRYDAYGFDIAFFNQDRINKVTERYPDLQGRLCAASADFLPFDNKQFQTVTSFYGPLSYVENGASMVKVLEELLRILKKGGQIIAAPAELSQPEGNFFWMINQLINNDFSDLGIVVDLEEITQAWTQELRNLLENKQITIQTIHTRWAYELRHQDYSSSTGIGIITKL